MPCLSWSLFDFWCLVCLEVYFTLNTLTVLRFTLLLMPLTLWTLLWQCLCHPHHQDIIFLKLSWMNLIKLYHLQVMSVFDPLAWSLDCSLGHSDPSCHDPLTFNSPWESTAQPITGNDLIMIPFDLGLPLIMSLLMPLITHLIITKVQVNQLQSYSDNLQ